MFKTHFYENHTSIIISIIPCSIKYLYKFYRLPPSHSLPIVYYTQKSPRIFNSKGLFFILLLPVLVPVLFSYLG